MHALCFKVAGKDKGQFTPSCASVESADSTVNLMVLYSFLRFL